MSNFRYVITAGPILGILGGCNQNTISLMTV